jgi:hypothetical protein
MSYNHDPVSFWAERLGRFHSEAVGVLAFVESSSVRRLSLDKSYQQLKSLNLQEDELFRQSLRCVELQVYRAAHVMAWCGFFDCVLRLFESDEFATLKSVRANWNFENREELTESYSEHQIIEALKPAAIIGKADQKALIGLLSRRNECAHPTTYFPDLNQTLGYISELFMRLEKLENKHPEFLLPS